MFNKAKRNNLKVLHTKKKNVDMLKTKQSIKQKKNLENVCREGTCKTLPFILALSSFTNFALNKVSLSCHWL